MDDGLLFFKVMFGVVFALIAGVLVMGVVATFRRRRAHARLMSTGVRGTATVVDNQTTSRSDTDGDSYLTFRPVVVLDNQDDARPVTVDADSRTSYLVGSKLDVVYDPTDLSKVQTLDAPSPLFYIGAAVMFAMLVGFAVFAVIGFLATDDLGGASVEHWVVDP